jgi:hypothetical protein
LDRDLGERVPALTARIESERELWAPEPPGQDILLGDVFVPYVLALLKAPDDHQRELTAAFALIEDLAENPDHRLEWLAVVSILEALEDHAELLKTGEKWMGPATRDKLPTRDWVQAHAQARD